MSSAFSCIVIKSDRRSRKVPLLGEIVRVDGREDFFIVMSIDRFHRVAQLMERSGKHRLVDIPFTSLRPFKRNLSQVVRRFLDAQEAMKRQVRKPDLA